MFDVALWLAYIFLHCALSMAAQCIVIGPVYVFATRRRAGGVGLLPR